MSKQECRPSYLRHKLAIAAAVNQKGAPKVAEIFTRKPYGAANDLGEILKRKRAKAAEKARHHRYYEAHKEEQVEKMRGWRDANRDRLHVQQKRYREKHAEELREKRQAYYEANKERIKAKSAGELLEEKRMSRDEVKNDLQLPTREDHKLERAIQRVRVLYVEAKHTPGVRNPIAWALYRAWNEIELTEVRPR